MSRIAREKSESCIYHVTTRGNGQMIIFTDDQDRNVMLSYIKGSMESTNVTLLGWCLMDNHIHLLIQDAYFSLPRAMKLISGSYANYFNNKYSHKGHVFQDRYASFPIETESYFLNAIRYIHNNPQKAGICKTEEYRWSSFNNYASGKGICDTSLLLSIIGGSSQFLNFSKEDDNLLPLSLRGESDYPPEELQATATDALLRAGIDASPKAMNRLSRTDRREAICQLAKTGMSVKQIAQTTGISKSSIYRAITPTE